MTTNEELIKKLENKEEAGMERTKQWVSMWQESLRYFFGDQLHGKPQHKDWDWIIINYIWPSAMQEIAKLTKYFSEIQTLPWETSDADATEAWQSNLQWQWEKGVNGTGMRFEQMYAILCGKIFGYRVSKWFWDDRCYWADRNKRWMGDVKHRLWHPAEFWASDSEKIQDGDCGTVRYVELEWAQARWPKFAKKLEEKASTYKELTTGGDTIRGQLATAGTYPSAGTGGIDKGIGTSNNDLLNRILSADRMTSGQQIKDDKKFVKLSECYFKDFTERPQKLEQDIPADELVANGDLTSAGGIYYGRNGKPFPLDEWPKRTVKSWVEPDYPNGRYITRCDDIILNPESQKWPYKTWPFVVIPHYMLPFMWQGVNGVEMYKNVQDMINVTVSHLTNNMKMFGDPKIMVERGAIDTPPGRHKEHYRIGKAAGSIIRLVKGAISGKRVAIVDPVTPSAAALQLYGLFTQEFKNLIGLQDVATGKAGTNLTATESSYLAISSHDRIALQNVMETEWVKSSVSLIAEICQKNYSPGRWVRIVGKDKAIGVKQITQQMSEVRFDIDIQPAPALPMDKEKRLIKMKLAYELMAGPVNPMLEIMLKELEVPNWRKLLSEHQMWIEYQKFLKLYSLITSGKIPLAEGLRIFTEYVKNKIAPELAMLPRKEKNEKNDEIKTEITREKKTDTSTEGIKQTVTRTAPPAGGGGGY